MTNKDALFAAIEVRLQLNKQNCKHYGHKYVDVLYADDGPRMCCKRCSKVKSV